MEIARRHFLSAADADRINRLAARMDILASPDAEDAAPNRKPGTPCSPSAAATRRQKRKAQRRARAQQRK